MKCATVRLLPPACIAVQDSAARCGYVLEQQMCCYYDWYHMVLAGCSLP